MSIRMIDYCCGVCIKAGHVKTGSWGEIKVHVKRTHHRIGHLKKKLGSYGAVGPFIKKVERIRCPNCGEWGAVRLGLKNLNCISCGKRFKLAQGALMDGVFLEKWPNMRDRVGKYIHEGCMGLGLSKGTEVRAGALMKKLTTTRGLSGNPRAIAGGLIYLAAGAEKERRTQRDVGDVMNVTEVTVRNSYRRIFYDLNLERWE